MIAIAITIALAALASASAAPAGCDANLTWWYDSPAMAHGAGFRNVKAFGATGDGVTDDTAAIIAAMETGRQPVYGISTPQALYFPPGTYIVSASIPIYFYTFVSGSPCAPSIVRFIDNANFQGYMFDGDFGQGEWGDDDDQFYRSISHLTIVMGAGNPGATGIHWAQSQAAHLRNVTIDMSLSGKCGLFGENGSGGFMDGVTIIGGEIPFNFGNQQYAINNLRIVGLPGTTTCMSLLWSWTLTFTNTVLSNCPVGISFTGGQAGALVLVDTTMSNVGVGIVTDFVPGQSWSKSASLYLERLTAVNVSLITTGLPGAAAGTTTVASWAQGPTYRKGVLVTEGQSTLPPVLTAPIVLPPRPTLAQLALADIVNVYSHGAKGDGIVDDTAALQAAIAAQPAGGAVFLPQGAYLLSDTLVLRADSVLIGEALSELRPSPTAPLWANAAAPAPLVMLPAPTPADGGAAPALMDLLFATTGAGDMPGLVMLDWQSGPATRLWDVHARLYDGAHTIVRVHGEGAGGVWCNSWNWVADHNVQTNAPLTVKNPRGVDVEGIGGPLLLYAVASEHSVLTQFNFSASANVVQVTAQIETAYWLNPQTGWGLTVESMTGPYTLYGGGFYSWGYLFNNSLAQTIVRVLDSPSATLYSLNTHGAVMQEVGDVVIPANTTQDQAPFCSTVIAVLNE